MKDYFVYILTNKSKTPYTGITNNLNRRIYEHKNRLIEGFQKNITLINLSILKCLIIQMMLSEEKNK